MPRTILQQYEDAVRVTKYNKAAKRLLNLGTSKIVAADTETTGLLFHTPSYLFDDGCCRVGNPFPFGISLCFEYKKRTIMVWGRYKSDLYKACKDILANQAVKGWHNMKYDLRVCKTNDIPVNGDQVCTLTMSRIYWDRRKSHRLQALSEFVCPQISNWEVELKRELTRLRNRYTRAEYPKDYVNYSFLPDDMIGLYSMTDTFMVWQLMKKLMPKMTEEYEELFERELNVVRVVSKIEENGMGFDAKRGRREIERSEPKIAEQWEVLENMGGTDFTMHPPKIIAALRLFGVKVEQLKKDGKLTSEADTLKQAIREGVPKRAEKFIKALLNYRALVKITNTYLKPLTEMAERTGGTVYTNINPTDSRTGRPASRDPNLLNIPRTETKSHFENSVRECFVPRTGKVVYYFDISQQEMALLLLYCRQYGMLEDYANGADIHQRMADELGRPDERDWVKNNNFAVVYGQGVKTMAARFGMSIGEAKEGMKLYQKAFSFVGDLQDRLRIELRQQGYVEDYFGRKYHVPFGQAYKAVNAIVQGGSAQAFKIGLLNVDDALTNERIILPVYDELQIERNLPRTKSVERRWCLDVIGRMTDVPQVVDRGLTFRVDVAKMVTNWAEKKELKI